MQTVFGKSSRFASDDLNNSGPGPNYDVVGASKAAVGKVTGGKIGNPAVRVIICV